MKTEQAVQGLQVFAFCVVNADSTVVFKHFEDLKDLINFNSKVMIKFRSKFQFQIPLKFYRTVEKVETCDGNGQVLTSTTTFSTFPVWLLFCFFMLEIQAY